MRITLQAVALALLVCGCGVGRESSAGTEPTSGSVPPGTVTTEIVGASPKQKQIILASLAGVGDRRILTITVAKADSRWGVPDGVGLEFTPRPEAAEDMRSSWEAFLIGDAFATRSRELSLPPVAYVSVPGVGASASGEPGWASTEEEVKAFIRRLEVESERAGAKVRDVDVLRPLGYAVAATLEVPDPAAFLDRRAPDFFERLGEPPGDFDLRIVDSKGGRVSENWNSGSGGAVWVRKDLEGCSPYIVSLPSSYEPPPCPSDQSPRRQ
jgi:hypothetical protein